MRAGAPGYPPNPHLMRVDELVSSITEPRELFCTTSLSLSVISLFFCVDGQIAEQVPFVTGLQKYEL